MGLIYKSYLQSFVAAAGYNFDPRTQRFVPNVISLIFI